MLTAEPIASCRSGSWAAAAPAVSVVVATHDRAAFLPGLMAAIEELQSPPGGLELVIADDGSSDVTWPQLRRQIAATRLPALALRLPPCGGPSVPRNTAAAHARGALLALTDDDCLPEPGWVVALASALDAGAGIAQGTTLPVDGGPDGPWDRTIEVRPLSGLWETCNLGVRATAFCELGGFPVRSALRRAARGFGEDVLLGAAVARRHGAVAAPAAVVRHRWLPGSYRDHLAGRRRLVGFPMLVAEVPELRERMWSGRFLTRRTAMVDLGLGALVVAGLSRRPITAAAALPWLVTATRDARHRPGRPLPWRLAQVLAADLVAAASLAEGSIRHRTPLL